MSLTLDRLREDIQSDLSQVHPQYKNALKALRMLNKCHYDQIRNFCPSFVAQSSKAAAMVFVLGFDLFLNILKATDPNELNLNKSKLMKNFLIKLDFLPLFFSFD
jgi:hypothetical protein